MFLTIVKLFISCLILLWTEDVFRRFRVDPLLKL